MDVWLRVKGFREFQALGFGLSKVWVWVEGSKRSSESEAARNFYKRCAALSRAGRCRNLVRGCSVLGFTSTRLQADIFTVGVTLWLPCSYSTAILEFNSAHSLRVESQDRTGVSLKP